MRRRMAIALVLILGAMGIVRAQAVSGPALITEQLSGEDSRQIDAAVAAIDEMLAAEPANATAYLRATWLRLLMDHKRYRDAARLAQAGVLAVPENTASVELCQRMLVTALLKDGRPGEALAAAKSLFNVSTMATTESTLLLLTECLNAADAGEARRVERLIEEQTAGALVLEAGAPAVVSAVLKEIRVPAEAYDRTLKQLADGPEGLPPTTPELWARGNLLLLADRPAEARVCFAQVVQRAEYHELLAAHDAMARCLKAEDGTVGRANAYVLGLRKATK